MSDLSALADALRQSLKIRIGVALTDPRRPAPPLWPEEEPATARMTPKRRQEFAAGRAAARAAMVDLGVPQQAIPMQKDRAPQWPQGLTGSISHCDSAAIAVVAQKDALACLGIDIEQDQPLDPDLWRDILTRAEQKWLMTQPEHRRGQAATRFFSAKEAVYKAQYPLTGQVLEFTSVSVVFDGTGFRAKLSLQHPQLPTVFTGQTFDADGVIGSLVHCPLPESTPIFRAPA